MPPSDWRRSPPRFSNAGIEVATSTTIVNEIWKKLALNVCTLPTSALLRFPAHELNRHEGSRALMRGLLAEVAAVARAAGIDLDESERWDAITSLLDRAIGGRSSMLQDVEAGRRTEIDVINGAICAAGQAGGVPTPLNDAMVWLDQRTPGAVPGGPGIARPATSAAVASVLLRGGHSLPTGTGRAAVMPWRRSGRGDRLVQRLPPVDADDLSVTWAASSLASHATRPRDPRGCKVAVRNQGEQCSGLAPRLMTASSMCDVDHPRAPSS